MMGASDRRRRPDDNTIVYHFDVGDHSIPLEQFIDTALATKAIVETFNEQWFAGRLNYELKIVPPKRGGLIKIIKLLIKNKDKRIIFASAISMLSSKTRGDFLAGAAMKISGKKNVKEIGESLVSEFEEFLPEEQKAEALLEAEKETSPDHGKLIQQREDAQSEEFEGGSFEESVFAESVTQFLEEAPEKLEKAGLPMKQFRRAYEAKNRLLQACIDNPEVKGLGFSESDDFPVQEEDFERLQTNIVEVLEQEIAENLPTLVDITSVTVHSPNWDPEGTRGWQGKAYGQKTISFTIQDAKFWRQVLDKKIKPIIGDFMEVQWIYTETNGRPSHVRVLKVISFNGQNISEPLGGEALEDETGKYEMKRIVEREIEDKNLDLFKESHLIEEETDNLQQVRLTEE